MSVLTKMSTAELLKKLNKKNHSQLFEGNLSWCNRGQCTVTAALVDAIEENAL